MLLNIKNLTTEPIISCSQNTIKPQVMLCKAVYLGHSGNDPLLRNLGGLIHLKLSQQNSIWQDLCNWHQLTHSSSQMSYLIVVSVNCTPVKSQHIVLSASKKHWPYRNRQGNLKWHFDNFQMVYDFREQKWGCYLWIVENVQIPASPCCCCCCDTKFSLCTVPAETDVPHTSPSNFHYWKLELCD